jgi:hypothetical protein
MTEHLGDLPLELRDTDVIPADGSVTFGYTSETSGSTPDGAERQVAKDLSQRELIGNEAGQLGVATAMDGTTDLLRPGDPHLSLADMDYKLADRRTAKPVALVSPAEVDARKSDGQLEREVENRHYLVQHAKEVGDPLLRTAFDMAPTGKIPRSPITRTRTDPHRPGSEYRYSAQFNGKRGQPELTTFSCAFVPDGKAMQVPSGWRSQEDHPVTVRANFDGLDLKSLELVWPHRQICRENIRIPGQQLGPAWEEMTDEERNNGLLGRLVRTIDRREAHRGELGLINEGYVGIHFTGQHGTDPVVVAQAIATPYQEKLSRAEHVMWALSNPIGYGVHWALSPVLDPILNPPLKLPPIRQQVFSYDASRDTFVKNGKNDISPDIPATQVMQLMDQLAGFFPILS